MTVVSKQCLECDEPLFGRVDKKFCNDQCRNAYNNRVNKTTNDFVRHVCDFKKKQKNNSQFVEWKRKV